MADEIQTLKPLMAVLLPVTSIIVALIIPGCYAQAKKAVFILGAAAFGIVASMLGEIQNGKTLYTDLFPAASQFGEYPRINLTFAVDRFGYYYALLSSFIWLATTLFPCLNIL